MTTPTPPTIFTSSCDWCGEEMYPEESVYLDGIKDDDDGSIIQGAELCGRCAYKLRRERKVRRG